MPVEEREIEHELEKKWYTLEEQAQEDMMMMQQQREAQQSPTMFEESKAAAGAADHFNTTGASTSNPFRMLNKKYKEYQLQAMVSMSNLDVKRVKYSYKQTSPTGEDKMFSVDSSSHHHHYNQGDRDY